jgi:hypothetical protein
MSAPLVTVEAPKTRRNAKLALCVVAICVVLLALLQGNAWLAFSLAPLAWFAWFLGRADRTEMAASLASTALDRASRGRFDEARAILASIPARERTTVVGQMVDTQLAALAFYEGKLGEAITHATAGIREGKRLGFLGVVHRGSGLSFRALARAGLGQEREAREDVAALRALSVQIPGFLARASLAEALLLARAKDYDALRELLGRERTLLLEGVTPRERVLVRTLFRFVAAKKTHVYREPAKREEPELDEATRWIEGLVPEASSFVQKPSSSATSVLEAPTAVDAETRQAAERDIPKARPPVRLILGTMLALGTASLASWFALENLATTTQGELPSPPSDDLTAWSSLAPMAVICVMMAVYLLLAKRVTRELQKGMELRKRGRVDEARAAFEKLARSKLPLVAPQADRELAGLAHGRGEMRQAQEIAARGLKTLLASPSGRTVGKAALWPQLEGELAFAFAGEGRIARAREGVEKLKTLFPHYPYLARDVFRIELLCLVTSGSLDEAAKLAASRPQDLWLSVAEELLCDALVVHAGMRLPEGERERIEADLRDDERSATWVFGVAPTLRASFQGAASARKRVEVDPPTSEAPDSLVEPESEELPESDQLDDQAEARDAGKLRRLEPS